MKWLLRAVLMLLAALMVLAAAWAWQLNYLDGVAIDEPRPEPGPAYQGICESGWRRHQ